MRSTDPSTDGDAHFNATLDAASNAATDTGDGAAPNASRPNRLTDTDGRANSIERPNCRQHHCRTNRHRIANIIQQRCSRNRSRE